MATIQEKIIAGRWVASSQALTYRRLIQHCRGLTNRYKWRSFRLTLLPSLTITHRARPVLGDSMGRHTNIRMGSILVDYEWVMRTGNQSLGATRVRCAGSRSNGRKRLDEIGSKQCALCMRCTVCEDQFFYHLLRRFPDDGNHRFWSRIVLRGDASWKYNFPANQLHSPLCSPALPPSTVSTPVLRSLWTSRIRVSLVGMSSPSSPSSPTSTLGTRTRYRGNSANDMCRCALSPFFSIPLLAY